jgi:mono/diheme cytochrome c family protein
MRDKRWVPSLATAVLLGSAVVMALAGCDRGVSVREAAAALTGGNPDRGQRLISSYGCGSCHAIPGVPGAQAKVGPPLAGLPERAYVAGVLPNTPRNLERWILDPPGVDAKTAMPNLGVSPSDARDIAAYLYTLR